MKTKALVQPAADKAEAPAKASPSAQRATSATAAHNPRARIHQAGNLAVYRALAGGVVQTQLAISDAGDPAEQEAQQVAAQLSGSPTPTQNRPVSIQRQASAPTATRTAPPIVQAVLRGGGGHPLDHSTRRTMEGQFGHDFGGVRVHTDSEADASARAVNARAYTAGQDIVFRREAYAPDSADGRRLLAHELTHVVQQGASTPDGAGGAAVVQRDVMNQSVGPSYAQALDDTTLLAEFEILEVTLATSRASSDENAALGGNLQVLRDEINARQLAFTPPAVAAPTPARGGATSLDAIPEGGEVVDQVGIINWDGDPEVRLRATPDTNAVNIITTLPFNTRLQVIKRMPGDWYVVSTTDGDIGYVAAMYVWTHLPEPDARLHRVQAGVSGTAIGIAERYYGQYADDWGQDLRFYVNVLAWANKIPVPNETAGWRQVHFQAGNLIWIPSQEFARTLKGVVNSGSYSYNILDALGLAEFIERVAELWDDFKRAISLSKQYLPEAIAYHVEQALVNALYSLALMLIAAIAILAISTAIGAAIGALAGGVGAAPGAAAGFEVGMVILDWLGLAMLVVWVGQALWETASAFGKFLSMVWDARGDERALDEAAWQFADAIGILLGNLLEAAVLYAASVGLETGVGRLKGTRLGKAIGETTLSKWVGERMLNVKTGRTKLPTPRRALRSLPVFRARVEILKGDSGHPANAQVRRISQTMERLAQEVYQSLLDRTATSPEAQRAYQAIDGKRDWSGAQFGRAFEAEMQLRLQTEAPGLSYQLQRADPAAGLPNRQPGRPDWRLPIGQGKEAIWDATMAGGSSQGKALKKYDTAFNEFIGEILYPRPPHVGDVPVPTVITPPVPDRGPGDRSEEEAQSVP